MPKPISIERIRREIYEDVSAHIIASAKTLDPPPDLHIDLEQLGGMSKGDRVSVSVRLRADGLTVRGHFSRWGRSPGLDSEISGGEPLLNGVLAWAKELSQLIVFHVHDNP